MVGQRIDTPVDGRFDFNYNVSGGEWEIRLIDLVDRVGVPHARSGQDYFVHPKYLWGHINPFLLGRSVWDNWLSWEAKASGAYTVDATGMVLAVHQDHSRAIDYHSPECDYNKTLFDGKHCYLDATTHYLTADGRCMER